MRSSVPGHRAIRHAKRDTLTLRWNRVLRPNYALKLTNAPAFLSSSGCPRHVGSLTLIRYVPLGATLKTAILASLISLTPAWPSLTGHLQSRTETTRKYPNELAAYQFYQNAKWKSLEPLVSTMADVRRLLGEPSEVHDVSQYTKAYPGDALAKKPVFTYVVDDDWRRYVTR